MDGWFLFAAKALVMVVAWHIAEKIEVVASQKWPSQTRQTLKFMALWFISDAAVDLSGLVFRILAPLLPLQ
jgi:hypothetical protein